MSSASQVPSATQQAPRRRGRAVRLGSCLLAVDVGTGSARAGLFDASGHLLARASHPIRLERPSPDHAEHSSDDIWQAVCTAAKAARAKADVPPESVTGLSFDA